MQYLPEPFYALNNYRQFIIYVIKPSETRSGKTDKFPLDYRTGKIANAHCSDIWTDANTAIEIAKKFGTQYGVGFVLTENDPFWFLDIDNCLNENQWSQVAIDLCTLFPDAATEVSRSGKGLHLIASGTCPSHSCKNNSFNLEFYNTGRFVALTGFGIRGNSGADYSSILPQLIEKYFPFKNDSNAPLIWTMEANEFWHGPENDEELIERALRSNSSQSVFGTKANFRDLWDCNTPVLTQNYPDTYRDRAYDESSVDAALAQHLAFWTGNNCERMLNLMQKSSLVRDKWDREDYLKLTISTACSRQKQWLCDKPKEVLKSSPAAEIPKPAAVIGNTYLSISDQAVLFTGCIYVQDENRILVPGGVMLAEKQFRATYGGFSFPMDNASERVIRNAWEAFTESQAFRKPLAISTCFRPDQTPGALIEVEGRLLANIWWPVNTKRVIGNAAPFLTHLEKILPNSRDRMILLCYMAACVQYPGVKFQWCPLLQGTEGNGKTLFSRCVAFAVGAKYSHFPNASEITEKYNDWMYRKLFIGVEDIHVADSSREVMECLKPMITREELAIRAMHTGQIMRDICCNFILNSNHKDGIRKTLNDRRFAPFYTAQQTKQDLERDGMTGDYFPNLWKWLERQDGFATVNELFHTFKIPDEFNPAFKNPAPLTSSTQEAIEHSLGGIEQEIMENIDQDIPGFRGGWISSMQFEKLLEKLNAHRRIPHNRRRELLQNMGYDWHPSLKEGRVNNTVLPDGGKPRLFLLKNHSALTLTNASDIAKAYSDAQIHKD